MLSVIVCLSMLPLLPYLESMNLSSFPLAFLLPKRKPTLYRLVFSLPHIITSENPIFILMDRCKWQSV